MLKHFSFVWRNVAYRTSQSGKLYTWYNNRVGEERVYAKLDRALVNGEWVDTFPDSLVSVQMEGISDHTPLVVQIENKIQKKATPFKFFNMWSLKDQFRVIVQRSWDQPVEGTRMFQICEKLKRLKYPLKQLNSEVFTNIVERAPKDEINLKLLQEQVSGDPNNVQIPLQERERLINNI
ncbi:OLC1v1030420C1 [Oldenlandia corymbosa var. corymbosa]|uniref:OLC1v1030420C1 n=1 Tax=Oldenlandia corymbosa var. corymbosa TaxID=529605 RepID=A0AAV1CGR4_OLDCO|nr:OLC1v1030420C1 [Oldenlandia corymbosa var. corymbosa]